MTYKALWRRQSRERAEMIEENQAERQANIDARHSKGEWLVGIDDPLPEGNKFVGCRCCSHLDRPPGCALCL